jgi:hypothetical protein
MIRRAALSLLLLVAVILGLLAVSAPAGAWKCDRHPEQPTCTTTTTPPENSTTLVTTTTVPPTVPDTTTTTELIPPPYTERYEKPPEVSENPPSITREPTPPRFAG